MNVKQLEEGQELLKLINITEKAIEELQKFAPEDRNKQAIYDDKSYWLSISKHTDGSGINAGLCRYYGNERLLKVINYKSTINKTLNSSLLTFYLQDLKFCCIRAKPESPQSCNVMGYKAMHSDLGS